ncbi:unnamed protein product [Caenorhabditis nigoni]
MEVMEVFLIDQSYFEDQRAELRALMRNNHRRLTAIRSYHAQLEYKLRFRMARPNMSVNQRFQILDLVNEAAIKIDQATQMLDQANIELMKKYIQVNNSQIVHLELSKFFI